MLKCPKNDKHDRFIQAINHITTKFMDSNGKRYSFPNQVIEKGRVFCVACGSVAVEVEE
jgi:hypothetical protein